MELSTVLLLGYCKVVYSGRRSGAVDSLWITFMMIGEYRHNIDAKKNRRSAKFRKEIGEKAIIAKGQEKCLFVYPVGEWEKVAEKLSQLPTGSADNRNFVRIFLSGAVDVEIDALGRILVPDYLKEFAGLKEKVVITGLYKKWKYGTRDIGTIIRPEWKAKPILWRKNWGIRSLLKCTYRYFERINRIVKSETGRCGFGRDD